MPETIAAVRERERESSLSTSLKHYQIAGGLNND